MTFTFPLNSDASQQKLAEAQRYTSQMDIRSDSQKSDHGIRLLSFYKTKTSPRFPSNNSRNILNLIIDESKIYQKVEKMFSSRKALKLCQLYPIKL